MNVVDLTQVRELAADLASAGGSRTSMASMTTVDAVRQAVSKGALNVKDAAKKLISGHPRSRHYPATISYDVSTNGLEVSAEIGPDKDRQQGALGNILEFGTSNNAPLPHLGPALALEEPRFPGWVAEAAVRALW